MPWFLVLFFGVIMLALQTFVLADRTQQVALFVLGTVASIVGGAGVGSALGFSRGEENLRLKVQPPFRRTFRLYEGLAQLRYHLSERRRGLKAEVSAGGDISFNSVVAAFDVADARLEEQIRTADDAFAEWRELVPNEAELLRRRLQDRSEQ